MNSSLAPRLTVRHLFALIPVAGLAWAVTAPFGDNSFLWHVRAGTLQLDAGRVLTEDPFTIEFAGDAWRTQSWLADLMYGSLERLFDGLSWVPYFMFAAVACTIALVLNATYRRAGSLMVMAAAGLLLCWQAVPFASARPAAFSYLLLAAIAGALLRERSMWAIPPLIWLWASLHGSFIVAIGLVVLEGIRHRSRRHFEVAAAGAVLATFTAHGWGVWQVLGAFVGNRSALELIQEWQPPDYSHPFMLPYALLVAGVVVAAARGRIDRGDLIVVLPFMVFGMLAVRNLFPAMIVLLPYVAGGLAPETTNAPRRDPPMVVAAIATAVFGLALVGLTRPVRLSEATFPPPAAMGALRPGPVFHGIAAGGFLIYGQWPERPILVDDRAELFGEEGFRRYLDVADGKRWRALFTELDISQALLDPKWPLVAVLSDAGWREVYRDEHFVVAVAP